MTRIHGWTRWVLLGLCACAAAPASPEQRLQEERRLLAPFLAAREVGCGELLVELTGNFHEQVGRPAVNPKVHTVVRETGEGFVETVWTNPTGQAASAFAITIGVPPEPTDTGWMAGTGTKFRVVNQLRVRVYEDRRALTLNATATGPVVLVKEAKSAPREVRQFAIADGAFRQP